MEPLNIQHSLSVKLTSDCEKIINDPKLNIQKKGSEISKAVNMYILEWVTN